MIDRKDFPRLTSDNHRITSPPDLEYNCIAWSVGDTQHWWQPGIFWPIVSDPDDHGLGALEQAYLFLRYSDCGMDTALEIGFEKVAIYGGGMLYTHAALQLPSGKWTSKLGKGEDIEHDTPNDVSGGLYGEVVQIMKRSITHRD